MKVTKFIILVLLVCVSAVANAAPEGKVDTEQFWTEAYQYFKRKYGAESDFATHARTNLQRVTTMHQNTGAAGSGLADTLADLVGYGKKDTSHAKETKIAPKKLETTQHKTVTPSEKKSASHTKVKQKEVTKKTKKVATKEKTKAVTSKATNKKKTASK